MKIRELSPDVILSNGRIFTLDAESTIAQAVAIKDIQVDLTIVGGDVVWERALADQKPRAMSQRVSEVNCARVADQPFHLLRLSIGRTYGSSQITSSRGCNVREICVGARSGAWATHNPSPAKKSARPSDDQPTTVSGASQTRRGGSPSLPTHGPDSNAEASLLDLQAHA